jgi:CHAD domain-containing protein
VNFKSPVILAIAMPFQFKKGEPPGEAVQRICHERIVKARARLWRGGRPAAVHGVRKDIKKLRALFRLVRGEIGQGTYRKGTKSLREAAKRLGAPQDAQLMLNTFEKLVGRQKRKFPEIRSALERHARRKARQFRKDDFVVLTQRLLRKTGRIAGNLKIQADGWTAIEPGLKASYRRGRAARDLAGRRPLPENFHDWRKQVKDLGYYFRLLSPAWPEEVRGLSHELKLLGARLGDDHDLAVLQEFVNGHHAGNSAGTKSLNRLIAARQGRLRSAALKLGTRIYAEVPAVIFRRLEKYWNNWRKTSKPNRAGPADRAGAPPERSSFRS